MRRHPTKGGLAVGVLLDEAGAPDRLRHLECEAVARGCQLIGHLLGHLLTAVVKWLWFSVCWLIERVIRVAVFRRVQRIEVRI